MKTWKLLALGSFVTMASGSATAETYEIDPAHVEIGFSIRHMGISNIIVQHWDEESDEEEEAGGSEDANLSRGLTRDDATSIQEICPLAQLVTPQREVKVKAQRLGIDLFKMRSFDFEIQRTRWTLEAAASRGIDVAVDMCQSLVNPAQSGALKHTQPE